MPPPRRTKFRRRDNEAGPSITHIYECEVMEGLEPFAAKEIRRMLPDARMLRGSREHGTVRFAHPTRVPARLWRQLRFSEAIFSVQRHAVPRPKALLGDQVFKAIVAQVKEAVLASGEAMSSLYISAAGAESAVMTRLRDELAATLGVTPGRIGDIQVRIVPGHGDEGGWETIVRLSAKPLSARTWRVRNFEGALNATAAAVMAYLTKPTTEDQVINLCCGSGTLAIERARLGGAARITAVDHDRAALDMAHENALAAGAKIDFQHGDATHTGHADGFFDALLADLPFGNKVGSHRTNTASYEPMMQEAARLVRTDGMAVIITHEITLLDGILARQADFWDVEKVIPVVQRGLHPRIYVLRRTQARTATSHA